MNITIYLTAPSIAGVTDPKETYAFGQLFEAYSGMDAEKVAIAGVGSIEPETPAGRRFVKTVKLNDEQATRWLAARGSTPPALRSAGRPPIGGTRLSVRISDETLRRIDMLRGNLSRHGFITATLANLCRTPLEITDRGCRCSAVCGSLCDLCRTALRPISDEQYHEMVERNRNA